MGYGIYDTTEMTIHTMTHQIKNHLHKNLLNYIFAQYPFSVTYI